MDCSHDKKIIWKNIKMKKIQVLIMLITIAIVVVACAPQNTTQESQEQVQTQSSEKPATFQEQPTPSQVECPHGRVHEDYPGCGLYRDSNSNGYCDYSE